MSRERRAVLPRVLSHSLPHTLGVVCGGPGSRRHLPCCRSLRTFAATRAAAPRPVSCCGCSSFGLSLPRTVCHVRSACRSSPVFLSPFGLLTPPLFREPWLALAVRVCVCVSLSLPFLFHARLFFIAFPPPLPPSHYSTLLAFTNKNHGIALPASLSDSFDSWLLHTGGRLPPPFFPPSLSPLLAIGYALTILASFSSFVFLLLLLRSFELVGPRWRATTHGEATYPFVKSWKGGGRGGRASGAL